MDIASLGFSIDSTEARRASTDLDQLTASGRRTEQAADSLSNAAVRSTRGIGQMRGAVGQLGFQIQDIAVQLQSGQNALLVFGQQGSQIASIFGPGGAIAGAVLAVGAAIGTALLPKLFDTGDAAELLEESFERLEDTIQTTKNGTLELTEEFARLAEVSEEVATVQLKARLIEALNASNLALQTFKENSADLNVNLAQSGNAVRGNENRLRRLAESYGITSKELRTLSDLTKTAFSTGAADDIAALREEVNRLVLGSDTVTDDFVELAQSINESANQFESAEEKAEFLRGAIADLGKAVSDASDDNEKLRKSLDRQIAALEFQAATLGNTEREIDLYRAALAGATEEQLASINASYDQIEAYEAEQEAIKELTEEQKKLAAEREKAERANLTSATKLRIEAMTDEERIVYDLTQAYDELLRLVDEGVISEDEAGRIGDILGDTAQEDLKAISDSVKEIGVSADEAARRMQGALGDEIFNVIEGNFDNLGDTAVRVFNRIVAEALAAQAVVALLGEDYSSGQSTDYGGLVGDVLKLFSGDSGGGSFEGGGYTGSGPRTGGVDGRGGQLAILHPQETVVDHAQGQSMGNQVNNFTFNFPNVRTERDAQLAGGAAARQFNQAMNAGRRYG